MPATTHPSSDRLRAFHCGKLAGPDADAVEAHLAACDTCVSVLRTLPDDPMVEMARAAGRESAVVGASTQPSGAHPDPAQTKTCPTAAFVTPPPVEIPPELEAHPRYRVLRPLGYGGMGAVFLAEHRKMARRVALKVIRRALLASPAAAPRFQKEVEAAARLDHPNIVRAFDADQAGDLHFLVMEYVDGTDLAKVLRRRGPLPVPHACEYARQAALGLQHAHERGTVHRDIKPHNLMLTATGRVKILDFGLAGVVRGGATEPATEPAADADTPFLDAQLTAPGTVMGTADYVAPEQARAPSGVDTRADIYSLGCTLYQLLAGRVPFDRGSLADKMVRHAADAPRPLAEFRPDVPAELARVVERMMAKAPADRYQTPAEVAAALTPFTRLPSPPAEDLPPLEPAGAAEVPARPAPRKRRRVGPALGLAAFALLAAGAAVYHIQTDNGEVVVTAESDDVELVIGKGGKEVTVIDTKTKKKITLPTGEYDVAVKNPDGFAVSTDKLVIRRGAETLVTVERVKKPGPTPAANPQAVVFLSQAQAALDRGENDKAVKAATAALKLDPGLNAARNIRGVALGRQGQWAAAEAEFDEMIRRNPRSGLAFGDRGWARLNRGKYREGIADADRAAELGHDPAIRLANRGYSHAMLGEFEKALADYDEAVRREPRNAVFLWVRGQLRGRLGDADGARADAAAAARENPKIEERAAGFSPLPPAKK